MSKTRNIPPPVSGVCLSVRLGQSRLIAVEATPSRNSCVRHLLAFFLSFSMEVA